MCRFVGSGGTLPRCVSPLTRRRRTFQCSLKLSYASVPVVQFGIEDTHSPQVESLKALELSAEVDQFELALRQSCANRGQFLALTREFCLLWSELSNNLT